MSAEILGKGHVDRVGLAPEEPPRITGEDDKKELPSPATRKDVVQLDLQLQRAIIQARLQHTW
jgi:hypothetical protein